MSARLDDLLQSWPASPAHTALSSALVTPPAAMPEATRWAVTGYDIGELTAGSVAKLEFAPIA